MMSFNANLELFVRMLRKDGFIKEDTTRNCILTPNMHHKKLKSEVLDSFSRQFFTGKKVYD